MIIIEDRHSTCPDGSRERFVGFLRWKGGFHLIFFCSRSLEFEIAVHLLNWYNIDCIAAKVSRHNCFGLSGSSLSRKGGWLGTRSNLSANFNNRSIDTLSHNRSNCRNFFVISTGSLRNPALLSHT
jgi:hypothetical protein